MIETRNLSYIYMPGTPFQIEALKDITLGIEKGSFVGIIGETGSGKSTLVQHFNGLLKPTTGKILVNGTDIWSRSYDLRKLRSKIALLFQFPEHQLFEDTVFKDVAFGPRNMGLKDEALARRVRMGLEMVGLDYEIYKERSPFTLSGGEKRRVALAGILAMQPEVIILDEPTAGMDPLGRRNLLQRIERLHKEENLTVILVTHNMEDIARLADKLVVFFEGKIVFQGTPGDVFAFAEQIREIGLDVPPLTELLQELRKRGKDIRTDFFTAEEAAAEILSSLAWRDRL